MASSRSASAYFRMPSRTASTFISRASHACSRVMTPPLPASHRLATRRFTISAPLALGDRRWTVVVRSSTIPQMARYAAISSSIGRHRS